MSVGEEIRSRREALGLTQVQLARRLRCTAYSVSRWEHGHHLPAKWFWAGIWRVLGVQVAPDKGRRVEPAPMGTGDRAGVANGQTSRH